VLERNCQIGNYDHGAQHRGLVGKPPTRTDSTAMAAWSGLCTSTPAGWTSPASQARKLAAALIAAADELDRLDA
jgi:hypothetical protein